MKMGAHLTDRGEQLGRHPVNLAGHGVIQNLLTELHDEATQHRRLNFVLERDLLAGLHRRDSFRDRLLLRTRDFGRGTTFATLMPFS